MPHLWPESGPFVIQKGHKRGRFDPFCGRKNQDLTHEKYEKARTKDQVSRKARKGRKEKPAKRAETRPVRECVSDSRFQRSQGLESFTRPLPDPGLEALQNHEPNGP